MTDSQKKRFDFESYLEALEDAMEKVREASLIMNNVQIKLGHLNSREEQPPDSSRAARGRGRTAKSVNTPF